MFLIKLVQFIKDASWTSIFNDVDWGGLVNQAVSCSLPGFICTCRAPFGEIAFMDIDLPWGVDTWEEELSVICPATALTKVGASFATQGYWVQADLLDYLTLSSFGSWAIIIYILAVIGGLISVAIGQPPRNYIWFFLGPALYSWLLDTREPVTGVQWAVGSQLQNQAEVWKISEVALSNTNMARRLGADSQSFIDFSPGLVFTSTHPPIQAQFMGENHRPGWAKVYVASLFVWYDELISSAVQWMVDWSGVTRQNSSLIVGGIAEAFGIPINSSNIPGTANLASLISPEAGRWYLLTDSKWGLLESITSARVRSPDLRDAFHTFFASECGDVFKANVNDAAFIAASSTSAEAIPASIFLQRRSIDDYIDGVAIPGGFEVLEGVLNSEYNHYEGLRSGLRGYFVPLPRSLRKFTEKRARGSFRMAVDWEQSLEFDPTADDVGDMFAFETLLEKAVKLSRIRCDGYLDILISALRWEAGHITYNLVQGVPDVAGPDHFLSTLEGVLPGEIFGAINPLGNNKASAVVFNLFYGWDIDFGRNPFDPLGILDDLADAIGVGGFLDSARSQRFLTDMVLVHLIRNEFALAPAPTEVRYSGEQAAKNFSQLQVRELGSKNKFGELYTWALMMPYVQGVLLYFLAIMYPFACLMILMPGMHKGIITWASFWAWAKLWDVGFAFVRSIERSVWAMIGNSSESARIADRIAEMQGWGAIHIDDKCSDGVVAGLAKVHCTIPSVQLYTPTATGYEWQGFTLDTFVDNLRIFDRALSLGAHLDLDLANAYYIYIMAALYFAVPAVTGQIVLGAKAGASSLISGAVSGVSGDAGRAASTGHQGQMAYMASTAQQSVGRAAHDKQLRQSGLASTSLNWGNKGLADRADSSALGVYGSGMDLMQQQYFDGMRANQDGVNVISTTASAAGQIGQTIRSRSGGSGGGGGQAQGLPTSDRVYNNQGEGAWDINNGGETANTPNTEAPTLGSLSYDSKKNMAQGLTAPLREKGPSISKLVGGSGGVATGLMEYGAPVVSAVAANARWQMTKAGAAAGSEFRQAKAAAGIDSFAASARSQGADMMAGRTGRYAEFDASMAAWDARNAYAAQASGGASVLGLMAGGLAPGAKPTDMTGLAMAGQLDTWNVDSEGKASVKDSAKMYANWASTDNNSGYGGRINQHEGNLQNSVGADPVAKRLEMHSLTDLAQSMSDSLFGAEDGTLRPSVTGGGQASTDGRGDQLSQRVAERGGQPVGVPRFQPQYREGDSEVNSGERKAGDPLALVPEFSVEPKKED